MNVTVCRNCAGEVSPDTGRCQRCGAVMFTPEPRHHRIMGGIAMVAAIAFLLGTSWFAFRQTGMSPADLPNCDDPAVIAAVMRDSPYVAWAQTSGTQPITALRDIRAEAWDGQKHVQYCTATASNAGGSYTVTYGLSQATPPAKGWHAAVIPGSPPGS